MTNPRSFARESGTWRAINITIPDEVYQIIRREKYARETTYAEVITHAILTTYAPHTKDKTNETETR
ncbi:MULTISPECIES: hypothetical protein [unclassified Actinobaculum]|uniref:hypothetical protein n=1 Tax=unclassified Actinobaculum TaxID=2609299 RepID=UPI000D528118|nr:MULTISPECIES: hypothetical protein [unclassified Actinobaculum]AWE42850.1 hypothetical protein DDD63_08970 [Actinobaculum sp. 313]RTE49070.1 hypothetical protein EKN07_08055 [Actinobaculum sp. 352]